MKLRIVSGQLGRRYITVDKCAQDFRPTQERVRIAAAEKIQPRIHGARVADLCAGSGAFGFELLSRGAALAYFVDNDRKRIDCIRKHAALFKVEDKCRIVQSDVNRFISTCTEKFDLIFCDPPYEDTSLLSLAGTIPALLVAGGMLVYERSVEAVLPDELFPEDIYERETRTYGSTTTEFIVKK